MDTLETTQATFNRNKDGSVDIVTVGGTDPHLSPEEARDVAKLLAKKVAKAEDDE